LARQERNFIKELFTLYLAFASASALDPIALKAATVLPIPLLQKPQKASKPIDHIACLERRVVSWKEDNLIDLLSEGKLYYLSYQNQLYS